MDGRSPPSKAKFVIKPQVGFGGAVAKITGKPVTPAKAVAAAIPASGKPGKAAPPPSAQPESAAAPAAPLMPAAAAGSSQKRAKQPEPSSPGEVSGTSSNDDRLPSQKGGVPESAPRTAPAMPHDHRRPQSSRQDRERERSQGGSRREGSRREHGERRRDDGGRGQHGERSKSSSRDAPNESPRESPRDHKGRRSDRDGHRSASPRREHRRDDDWEYDQEQRYHVHGSYDERRARDERQPERADPYALDRRFEPTQGRDPRDYRWRDPFEGGYRHDARESERDRLNRAYEQKMAREEQLERERRRQKSQEPAGERPRGRSMPDPVARPRAEPRAPARAGGTERTDLPLKQRHEVWRRSDQSRARAESKPRSLSNGEELPVASASRVRPLPPRPPPPRSTPPVVATAAPADVAPRAAAASSGLARSVAQHYASAAPMAAPDPPAAHLPLYSLASMELDAPPPPLPASGSYELHPSASMESAPPPLPGASMELDTPPPPPLPASPPRAASSPPPTPRPQPTAQPPRDFWALMPGDPLRARFCDVLRCAVKLDDFVKPAKTPQNPNELTNFDRCLQCDLAHQGMCLHRRRSVLQHALQCQAHY
jgi:hypothetical protein